MILFYSDYYNNNNFYWTSYLVQIKEFNIIYSTIGGPDVTRNIVMMF